MSPLDLSSFFFYLCICLFSIICPHPPSLSSLCSVPVPPVLSPSSFNKYTSVAGAFSNVCGLAAEFSSPHLRLASLFSLLSSRPSLSWPALRGLADFKSAGGVFPPILGCYVFNQSARLSFGETNTLIFSGGERSVQYQPASHTVFMSVLNKVGILVVLCFSVFCVERVLGSFGIA